MMRFTFSLAQAPAARAAAALSLVAVLALSGCGGGGQRGDDTADTLKLPSVDEVAKKVTDVVVTVPSPLELASLMQKSGANFNERILSSPASVAKYTNTFKQAVNLGVYGADLGYVTYFNQTQLATKYLQATTNLATSLRIMGAFEASQLERVERNLGNRDSILYIITEQFEAAETHLQNVERADVAALIVAGGWVEGLHLAGQLNRTKDNEMIRTRIGELKLSLTSVLHLLKKFEKTEGVQPLYTELMELYKLYEQHVTIDYDSKPASVSKPKPGEGDVVKVDIGTTSKVTITPEGLKAILDKGDAIRQRIVS